MKTKSMLQIALFFGASLLPSIGLGGTMDSILKGKTHDQVIAASAALKGSIDEQLYVDLIRAVRSLERHAEDQGKLGVTEAECERYFVSLVGGKSIREVIRIAASIMLTESAELPLENALEGVPPQSEERARRQHLIHQRTIGLYFLRTYVLNNP